jgi:hypothetical protein
MPLVEINAVLGQQPIIKQNDTRIECAFSADNLTLLSTTGRRPRLMMDAAPLALNTKDSLRDLFVRKWSFVFRFEFDYLLSV